MDALLRINPVARVGHVFMLFLAAIGRLALFTSHILGEGIRKPYYPRQFVRMMIEIGYYSLQLKRIGEGKSPDPELSPLLAIPLLGFNYTSGILGRMFR